jgi:hypothetical protein
LGGAIHRRSRGVISRGGSPPDAVGRVAYRCAGAFRGVAHSPDSQKLRWLEMAAIYQKLAEQLEEIHRLSDKPSE